MLLHHTVYPSNSLDEHNHLFPEVLWCSFHAVLIKKDCSMSGSLRPSRCKRNSFILKHFISHILYIKMVMCCFISFLLSCFWKALKTRLLLNTMPKVVVMVLVISLTSQFLFSNTMLLSNCRIKWDTSTMYNIIQS